MDWQFITHHLTSGYTPVASALVLYFILLHVMGKRQTIGHIIFFHLYSAFILWEY